MPVYRCRRARKNARMPRRSHGPLYVRPTVRLAGHRGSRRRRVAVRIDRLLRTDLTWIVRCLGWIQWRRRHDRSHGVEHFGYVRRDGCDWREDGLRHRVRVVVRRSDVIPSDVSRAPSAPVAWGAPSVAITVAPSVPVTPTMPVPPTVIGVGVMSPGVVNARMSMTPVTPTVVSEGVMTRAVGVATVPAMSAAMATLGEAWGHREKS